MCAPQERAPRINLGPTNQSRVLRVVRLWRSPALCFLSLTQRRIRNFREPRRVNARRDLKPHWRWARRFVSLPILASQRAVFDIAPVRRRNIPSPRLCPQPARRSRRWMNSMRPKEQAVEKITARVNFAPPALLRSSRTGPLLGAHLSSAPLVTFLNSLLTIGRCVSPISWSRCGRADRWRTVESAPAHLPAGQASIEHSADLVPAATFRRPLSCW